MGKWKVWSRCFYDSRYYQVYRLIDEHDIDHSRNREYKGAVFSDESSAQALADKLNMEDGKDD